MLFDHIDWDDNNILHATRHGVSIDEIEQAIANAATARPNRRKRSGDIRNETEADAGRRVVVIARLDRARDRVRPITAWEA